MDCGGVRGNAHTIAGLFDALGHLSRASTLVVLTGSLLWFSLPCWFPNRGRSAEFCLTGDQREYSVVLPGDGAVCIFFHSPVAGLAALTRRSRRRAGIRGSAATDPVKTVAVLATSRVSRLF